MKEVEPELFLW